MNAILKKISEKRIKKEKDALTNHKPAFVKEFSVDATKESLWRVILLPNSEPYKNAAFALTLDFNPEFPFKPPRVTFITKIYHPNVDANGNICVNLLQIENWKAAISIQNILEAVLQLIDNPEPERCLRENIAEEFVNNYKKFVSNAQEHAKKEGEKRK